jgi:hypothetical protein
VVTCRDQIAVPFGASYARLSKVVLSFDQEQVVRCPCQSSLEVRFIGGIAVEGSAAALEGIQG